MYKHLLIATDGSERSAKAVAHGIALAAALDARVTVLTVVAPLRSIPSDPTAIADIPGADSFVEDYLHGQAKASLETAAIAAQAEGVACETVQVENQHPYRAIIETAVAGSCDLIVMASHGRRGISAILLGSETVKVLTHSSVPVLVDRS